MTKDDLMYIAAHIMHNVEALNLRYSKSETMLDFADFIQTNVATDLKDKYSRYQIQEAFEDQRIKTVIDFYFDYQQAERTIH